MGTWNHRAVYFFSVVFFLSFLPFCGWSVCPLGEGEPDEVPAAVASGLEDTPFSHRFVHRVGFEYRPGYIPATHPFFRGENKNWESIRHSSSVHLKYAFQFRPNTCADRIYGGVYQGVGVGSYSFGDREQLGNPLAFYLLQGARIAWIAPRVSLNYEWNFGLSFGWHPYKADYNDYNMVIGSKVNAYINANFYLNWMVSRRVDIVSGITLTHFSNGNTKLPNAGLNTVGAKIGLVYNFNRKDDFLAIPLRFLPGPEFQRHMSYDLVTFGAWRRKGVRLEDGLLHVSPEAYTVLGFNFSAMYNLGYKIRTGVSLDGVYDGSANVDILQDYDHSEGEFSKPSFYRQSALGLSARVEYVMPYFSVSFGMGFNVFHGRGDLRSFYQVLALKTEVTRNSFLHIGYCLKEFRAPNFLMLGVGYRFNGRSQTYRP